MSDNIHPASPAEGVYEEEFTLAAGRADVFAALTDERALRIWFAERVEVEARVGGRFAFGGKFTPYILPTDPAQRLTALHPGEGLAFEWYWGGAPTQVTLSLSSIPGGTKLRVRHELGASTLGKNQRESTWLAHDFWGLSIGNLEHYLRTGKPALLPDHECVQQDASVQIEIEAPIEAVWEALTNPEDLRAWMDAVEPAVELRVGGKYSYGWRIDGAHCGPTEILELDPPRHLVVNWVHANDQTNRTEWRLQALAPNRTLVQVRQCRTALRHEFHGYKNGWAKYLFALRKRVLQPRADFCLAEAVPLLASTPGILSAWLRELPAVWLDANDQGRSWSPRQVLGHLIDGERHDWIPRTHHLLQHGTKQAFRPFDRYEHLRRESGSIASELDEFANLRSQGLRSLAALRLGQAELARSGSHPAFGTVQLRQHLATWVAHDLTHIAQIARTMARRYAGAVGPWQAYLGLLRS